MTIKARVRKILMEKKLVFIHLRFLVSAMAQAGHCIYA